MRLLQGSGYGKIENASTVSAPEVRGLAVWLLNLLRGWPGDGAAQRKQLQLVETLPLGGKRQLMLVTCAGERFLVGGGSESVETIVRLKAENSLTAALVSLDEQCL